MKQYLSILISCCLILALTACSQEAAPTQQPTTTQTATTAATVPTTVETEPTVPISSAVYVEPLSCVSLPVITETEVSGTTTLAYYSYPTVSILLPDADVAEVVKLDLLNRIDASAKAAQATIEAAKKDYTGQSDWYHYYTDVSYGVQRLDTNVLSVFGTESTFDGTPNSTTIGVSANYDLSTGGCLTLKSIMFPDFSADVLVELIVEGLSDYDESTLLPDYKEVISQMFATNVPVDSWYFDRTGLCFYFAPYEIAPHAMGIIYSHIPYASLSGLMKEAYFPVEDFVYSGSINVSVMNEVATESTEKYTQFGELTVGKGGAKYLLSAKGSILDLRIYELKEDNTPGKMLFASAGIGPDIAVLLDLPTDMNGLYVSFISNEETVTMPITELPKT